jgi:hypothetical protein
MPGPTRAIFGNTVLSLGFDFTFGPGVTPSVCNLYTIPHTDSLDQVGTLSFVTAGESPFYFYDCALEEPRLEVGSGGQRWVLPIKDRRWKWQSDWGPIYGHYNIPRPDGTYTRERTPQELATLCLTAMGESGFDVGRLPNSPRPEIHWDGAHAATELDQLCNSLGCVVVLNPVRNRVELWTIGQGSQLPNGPTQGSSYTPILPIRPESIVVEAGPTLFQATFHLAAVGLDTDGTWKPINLLSYMPIGGWSRADYLGGFPEVLGTYTSGNRVLPVRDLAQASVYRCYRIDGIGTAGNWTPNGISNVLLIPQSRKDFRFYTTLADEEISEDGGLRPIPCSVYGRWYDIEKSYLENAVPKWILGQDLITYTRGFNFDETTGIVTFSEPLVTYVLGRSYSAEMRLVTSFNAGRDGVYDRIRPEYFSGTSWTSPPRLIQRPEIFNRVVSRYSADGAFSVENDSAAVITKLAYWAIAASGEYDPQQGGTVRYARLIAISPDGLTQQITWSGGGGRAPSTTVSQAQRHNRFVEPQDHFRERKQAARLDQAEKAARGRVDGIARWGAGVV